MKKYLALAVLLLIAFACSDQRETNLAASQKLYNHFNAHDWKAMADLYADKAEFLDPSFGAEYVTQTHQQIVKKYSGMEQMFPDIHDEVKEMYAVDDKVIIQFVATGNSGDSIKLNLPICGILTFKDGKIIRDATYYDN
jgi:ketosteroid isomerase-like protein